MKSKFYSASFARMVTVLIVISILTIPAYATTLTMNTANITKEETETEIKFTVPYTADSDVKQVTILAVKGGQTAPDVVDNTNIVYINQQDSSVGSFTFTVDKSKFDATTPYIHIKLGGTGIDTPQQTAIRVYTSGYKITGTVSTAQALFNSGDTAIDEELNTAWKTTVYLRPTFLSEVVIATADVDTATKAFELTGIENGTYVLEIKRSGYLSRPISVSVENGDVNLGDKPLFAGDLNGDYSINVIDCSILFPRLGAEYGDGRYMAGIDLYGDGGINVIDCSKLFPNLGLDVTTYGESVDFEQ